MDKGQFLLYQTPDGDSRIEVKLQNDTVWLSLDQMAELFQRNKSTISRHIKNVLEDGELDEKEVVAFFAITTKHGAIEGKVQEHQVAFYNLDMIISVGYRVHSYRGVQFRIWATPKRHPHTCRQNLRQARQRESRPRIRQIQGAHKERPLTRRDSFLGEFRA